MEKDVYDEMMAFIAMQDKEWEIYCREYGWFRRLSERLFFLLTLIVYPFVGAFYFVKTGDIEKTPYDPMTPILYIDKMYKKLLLKIENR